MTLSLPPPGPNDHDASRRRRSRESAPKDAGIPSVDELLAMLLKLNGLVALDLVTTGQAGVIQRNLRIVLDTQMKRVRGQQQGLPHEALAELCRSDAHIVNLLEPFLTDEQVAWLTGAAKDNPDEQA